MTTFLRRFAYSKKVGLLIKLGFTLVAFWLVFRGIDVEHLRDILERQNHWLLLLAAVLIAGQIVLGALRWHLILGGLSGGCSPIPIRETMRMYYISVFFNCCLPGTVGGDVVRVWLVKSDHVPLPLSINSVLIDRIIALAALGLLVVIMLPWLGHYAQFNTTPLMLLALAASVAGFWLLLRLERLLARWQEWRPVRWLLHFVAGVHRLLEHRQASLLSLLYAVVAHVCYSLSAYVLAQSMAIEVTVIQALTLIPFVALISILPISIGGWGLREASMVGMLSLIGVPQAAALMLSVQLGLVGIVISLPGGLLWLAQRRHMPS